MKFNLILSVAVFISCAAPQPAQYFRTGEVTCVKNDARLVTVASIYRAGNSTQAQMFAERNAVENLLFKGISGCYDVPVIVDEQKSMQEHKSFYDWLITRREYERYITDRSLTANSTSGNGVSVNETITFDVSALRQEMEKQGVIKKFGF